MVMICWIWVDMVTKDMHLCADLNFWAALKGPDCGCNDQGYLCSFMVCVTNGQCSMQLPAIRIAQREPGTNMAWARGC